jgi:hypothetical protein
MGEMEARPAGESEDGTDLGGESTGLEVEVTGLKWSGPVQRGCIEADPFVMWVAISFVTIVVVLHFFLRGVKKPSSRRGG